MNYKRTEIYNIDFLWNLSSLQKREFLHNDDSHDAMKINFLGGCIMTFLLFSNFFVFLQFDNKHVL